MFPPYADLFEPLQKRGRLDARMDGSSGELGAETTSSASTASNGVCLGNLPHSNSNGGGLCDLSLEQPAEKRIRTEGAFGSTGEASDDGSSFEAGQGVDEAAVRGWAENIVRALHGCPSIEEAGRRCVDALTSFGGEVRNATLHEAEVEAASHEAEAAEAAPDSIEHLQHTKRVLMRAVNHLAQRCRQAEASVSEIDSVREELERSRDAQRRLAHHNEMLQGHLRLHLDSCR